MAIFLLGDVRLGVKKYHPLNYKNQINNKLREMFPTVKKIHALLFVKLLHGY
jgi:hypothetical protein